MGVNINGLRLLLHAHECGASFDRTLMIGRQGVTVEKREIRCLPSTMRTRLGTLDVAQLEWAEPLFRQLGAHQVDSVDATAYEGATILHDLNTPIPDDLRDRYDLIFDGGSLEHIFHVPQALTSFMQMLRVGGHIVFTVPTNNFTGHGFYQFSPELFFAVFSDANGFRMVDAFLYEENGRQQWYRLTPSSNPSRRLTFQNRVPAHLLVVVQKVAEVPVFASLPQQQVYYAAWTASATPHVRSRRLAWVVKWLPTRLRWLVLNTWNVRRRFRPDLFVKVIT